MATQDGGRLPRGLFVLVTTGRFTWSVHRTGSSTSVGRPSRRRAGGGTVLEHRRTCRRLIPEVPVHEPVITVVGNVGAPPRTRVVAGGSVVTDFRIASTPRKVDKATGAWSDGETIWFGVSCWRLLAENVAASVKTGDRVVVTGRLLAHSWKNEQGEDRSGLEIDAQAVGFDLSRGKAVQERSTPLAVTTDPGARPAEEPVEEVDEDDVSLGAPVGAAA
ncbi:MAG: single-strand binding protein [Frankiales bacterium]|nr:single-strand binding protein [Frankiales bacterium]